MVGDRVTFAGCAVDWTGRALRDVAELPELTRRRVLATVDRLSETGYGDVESLKGSTAEWRLRVGDYRVRFVVRIGADDTRIILVMRVMHRREVYR